MIGPGVNATERGTWRLRSAGWLWLLAWAAVLWSVHEPWLDLGGLVPERVRWLERFVLGSGAVAGCVAGTLGRRLCRPGRGWTHRKLLRWLLLPQTALTAGLLVGFRLAGAEPAIGVACNGFLAWWAGLDAALAAYPLTMGRAYSFSGPIPSDPCDAEQDDAELPPWMGV